MEPLADILDRVYIDIVVNAVHPIKEVVMARQAVVASNREGIQKAFEKLLAEIAQAISDETVSREEYYKAKMLEKSIQRMYKASV